MLMITLFIFTRILREGCFSHFLLMLDGIEIRYILFFFFLHLAEIHGFGCDLGVSSVGQFQEAASQLGHFSLVKSCRCTKKRFLDSDL